MAIKEGQGRWRGQFYSTNGGPTFDSREDAERYERNNPHEEDSAAEKLSTEDLRTIVNAQSFARQWELIQTEFVATNPGYIANEYNANKILDQLQLRGLINNERTMCTASIADVQRAFNDLAAKGMLQLGESGRKPFNLREAYEMPIDQLRSRINGFAEN